MLLGQPHYSPSWVVPTETVWPAKPKRSAVWPFTENVWWLPGKRDIWREQCYREPWTSHLAKARTTVAHPHPRAKRRLSHSHFQKYCSGQKEGKKYMASLFLVPSSLPQCLHSPSPADMKAWNTQPAGVSLLHYRQVSRRARNRSGSKSKRRCQLP